ncbi:osmotic avoidance abnormal protein 3-like [Venturia canescens]|uniref:osmotic avoidance abnormal protein 3-like n=1 Tax=Venturia canescens TaxID=32260 RepID=UPI001C9C3814|nr:osmotic avoidance abnormal protein 3-like [Venturia canescens]
MSESVKVAVRCRPLSQKEQQQGCRNVVSIDPLGKTCTLDGTSGGGGVGKIYQFDAAFGPSSTTEMLYEDVGSVIVEAVLEGYNGTVFAYGQTGCGKSHTMRGFIERTLEHIFEATSTSSTDTRYLALLSYLEIYNEKLRDLLQDGSGESLLQLKEDPSKGTYVSGGLREITVKNAAECSKLVSQGDARRAAAATKMNAASSRSHAVLTLSLEALAIDEDDKNGGAVRRGRLHLVDLAGSERQTRTGATGDRLKEAASINLSLSALGNVISALAAGNGRHVPYRDSKLTRLLRDSLGGNARTLMIACLSPCHLDAEETLSTLRYAARARCIKNKPIVNEDPKDALLRQYQLELQRLRKLLETSDGSRLLGGYSSPVDQEMDRNFQVENIEDINKKRIGYNGEAGNLRKECRDSNLPGEILRGEVDSVRSLQENSKSPSSMENLEESARSHEHGESKVVATMRHELDERRRKKREAAKREVMRRLEKLTIGGEARGNDEVRKRRERRRKRLEILAQALEKSAEDGNGGAFEVYGQLRSTEDALKRMAKKAKQLESEVADLQASWDAERRDLLRRELLATQLCDAMIPHLKAGCPFRDLESVRSSATWCDELGRWRLLDASSRIPMPPPLPRDISILPSQQKTDHNNNGGSMKNEDKDLEDRSSDDDYEDRYSIGNDEFNGGAANRRDIAGTYFRRNRIDELLAHAREAKTFEKSGRLSKSGGSEDFQSGVNGLQLSALNLQSSTPTINEIMSGSTLLKHAIGRQPPNRGIGSWITDENSSTRSGSYGSVKKVPPRILEALPAYPIGTATRMPS